MYILVLSNFTGLNSASNFGAIHSQSSSETLSIYKYHWKHAELHLSVPDDPQLCDQSQGPTHTPTHTHTHTLNDVFFILIPQRDWKNTGEQRLCCPSTLEEARWCSWAWGRRNGQSCWSGNSSPPRTMAAGTQRPPTGAGRAGEAERHRGRAAQIPSGRTAPQDQKGRKRIQRRCDTCGCAHACIMQTGDYSHTTATKEELRCA